MSIPNHLTALAEDINAVLARKAKNREEWIELELDTCRIFAEARAEFKDDIGFGHWMDDRYTYAGIPKPHPNECAAYVGMGKELKKARSVLAKTERSSIRYIYENEFASGPAQKPTRQPRKPGVKQAQRSVNATDDTWKEFTAKAAASGKAAADVLGELVEKAVDPDLPPAEEVLSQSALKKLAAYQRKLEREFDHRVWTAARKLQDEWHEEGMKHWNERLQKLERLLAFRSGVMKASEYKTLMLCCHTDTAANVGDAKRNEAVRILTEYKLKLMNEKEDPVVSRHGMPSVADLQKAREEVRARNSARSKATWAARRK